MKRVSTDQQMKNINLSDKQIISIEELHAGLYVLAEYKGNNYYYIIEQISYEHNDKQNYLFIYLASE